MNRKTHLPDFLVIGAQKSGTSSFYHYLAQHPDIVKALKKEIHFFDMKFNKGLSWYKSKFPLLSKKFKGNKITGEASPYYMFHPHAPKRICEIMPHAKLIAVLRNPVDRAYSHFHFNKKIKKPFKKAIQQERKRINKEKEKMVKRPNFHSNFYRRYSLLSRGIYVDQLKAFQPFFKRNQVLILRSEDLFKNPQKVMNQAFRFLNLENHRIHKFKVYNRRNYSRMNPSMRKELVEYFKPHNQRLYQFLGRDLGWDQ